MGKIICDKNYSKNHFVVGGEVYDVDIADNDNDDWDDGCRDKCS